MRLLLRCALISLFYSLAIGALFLRGPGPLSVLAFWLLYPLVCLASVLFAPILDSDSGANNLIGATLLSVPLNFVILTAALFLVSRYGARLWGLRRASRDAASQDTIVIDDRRGSAN